MVMLVQQSSSAVRLVSTSLKQSLEYNLIDNTQDQKVVCVNEELTADEWKRRYEKDKENNARLKGKMEKLELELTCWIAGETVNSEEQIDIDDIMVPSTANLKVEITAAAPTKGETMPATLVTGVMVGSIFLINAYA